MRKNVQSEFAHQAKQMASASAFQAAPVIEWMVKAVGSSPSDVVLDLACGPGIVAEALAPAVRGVVGIDLTVEMIGLAHERFEKASLRNGLFSAAAAEWLPFARGCFDQVMTRLSFHHLVDVAQVLLEIRRVLRPGGRLILADVVSSDVEEESALHNSLEKLRDPTHVRMFTRAELLNLIDLAGFELLHEQSWQQERSFLEWAWIIADATRTEPLEQVMRALGRAGRTAGIALREEGGVLLFTHTWIMVVAKAG